MQRLTYPDGTPYEALLAHHDVLLSFRTQADADDYVRKGMASLTPYERRRVAFRFLGADALAFRELVTGVSDMDDSTKWTDSDTDDSPLGEEMADMRISGPSGPKVLEGGGRSPDDVSATDYRVYNLLALADAMHDFADVPLEHADDEDVVAVAEAKRERIHRDLEVGELPFVKRDGVTVQMTLASIADKTTFIKDMTCNATLRIAGKDVSNEYLNGRNFEAGMYRHKSGEDLTAGYASRKEKACDGCRSAEMFCIKDGPFLVRVLEIINLREKMSKFFLGKDLKFVVDQNALPRPTKYDDKDRDRPGGHIVAVLLGLRKVINRLEADYKLDRRDMTPEFRDDTAAVKNLAKYNDAIESTWSVEVCDAGVYDGARFVQKDVRPEVTGSVFHRDSPVQFVFDSVTADGTYGYTIESKTVPVDVGNPRSGRTQVAKDVSKGVYTDRTSQRKAKERHDKASLDTVLDTWDDDINCIALLALKRAGDWGQIEHCKRYKLIFVTSDRLAALYATYRDVPMLYLHHHNFVQTATYKRDDNDVEFEFVQYSFAMCGSEAARYVLDPPKVARMTKSMWGGAPMMALAPFAAGIVLLCAVLGSTLPAS